MKPERRLTGTDMAVTIALVVLLAGLTLPVLSNLRETRRRAICLNHLKQIGLSIRLYSGDCSERFPTDSARTTLGSFGLLAKGYALRPGTALPGWTNQTWYGPFQSDYQAWICPSDTGVVAGSPTKPFTSANLSYAYGEFRLTENVQPDTPIACDRSSQGNPTGVTPWSNNRGTHRSDGGNVLFADGHVASRKTMAPPMYDGKNP